MFIISPPQSNRTTVIDDDDNSYVPAYIHNKAKVAPSTTWKTSYPLHKLSGASKTSIETSVPVPDIPKSQFFFHFFQNIKLFSMIFHSSSNHFISTCYSTTYSIQFIINKYYR